MIRDGRFRPAMALLSSRPGYLFGTPRIVHAYAIAYLMGRPGADVIIDHGMNFLWDSCRDPDHGGYYWAVGYDGPSDATKQAYGHAFVLLGRVERQGRRPSRR